MEPAMTNQPRTPDPETRASVSLLASLSDNLPGLVAEGKTIAETLEIARDVAQKFLEARYERG